MFSTSKALSDFPMFVSSLVPLVSLYLFSEPLFALFLLLFCSVQLWNGLELRPKKNKQKSLSWPIIPISTGSYLYKMKKLRKAQVFNEVIPSQKRCFGCHQTFASSYSVWATQIRWRQMGQLCVTTIFSCFHLSATQDSRQKCFAYQKTSLQRDQWFCL